LLDTTFLIDSLALKPLFTERLKEISDKELFISVISSAELLSGAKESQIKQVNNFLDSFISLPITDSLARKAGITRRMLKEKGFKKSIADILIGQAALENNLILTTGNPKDFPQLVSKKLILSFPE
jgi:predicted nucleic acid-binding protein